jgi:NADH dehydrogenase FAD-containing subunit
LGVRESYSDCR